MSRERETCCMREITETRCNGNALMGFSIFSATTTVLAAYADSPWGFLFVFGGFAVGMGIGANITYARAREEELAESFQEGFRRGREGAALWQDVVALGAGESEDRAEGSGAEVRIEMDNIVPGLINGAEGVARGI